MRVVKNARSLPIASLLGPAPASTATRTIIVRALRTGRELRLLFAFCHVPQQLLECGGVGVKECDTATLDIFCGIAVTDAEGVDWTLVSAGWEEEALWLQNSLPTTQ